MSEIDTLSQYFSRFPGIGTRQSRRFVYFLLSGSPQFARELARGIQSLIERTVQCGECRRYFSSDRVPPTAGAVAQGGPASGRESKLPRCALCADPALDVKTLMAVQKDVDLATIQKRGEYHGRFFDIGSLITLKEIKSPVVSPRTEALKAKIEKSAADGTLKEVILALSATPEGDHTALELKLFLQPSQEKYGITISSLGRGLSTGSELEYADGETLKSALESRK